MMMMEKMTWEETLSSLRCCVISDDGAAAAADC